MVAGAPSSCRPPWLLTMTPSTPSATARRASSGCRTPLSSSGPGQRRAQPRDVGPGSAGIEQARHACRRCAQVAAPRRPDVVGEGEVALCRACATARALCVSIRQRVAGGEPRRDREAVADVALAIAQHLVVGGQHQRVVARRLRRARRSAGQAAVAKTKTCIQRGAAPVAASSSMVQVEPWLRQKAVPACGRGPRGGELAIGPEQPGKPGRADDRPAGRAAGRTGRGSGRGRPCRRGAAAAASHRRKPPRCDAACARPRPRRRRSRTKRRGRARRASRRASATL